MLLGFLGGNERLQAGKRGPGVDNTGGEEICYDGVRLEGFEDGEDAGDAVMLEEEREGAEGSYEDYAGKGFFGGFWGLQGG